MGSDVQVLQNPRSRWSRIHVAVLVLIVLAGAYLRCEALGDRSLWRDELCTWQVSRMDLAESLRWGPELTQVPLYQLCLRAVNSDSHPSEHLLRLPAAVCGVLTVLAGWWLGMMAGGWPVGLGLAGLLALNGLQIEYSQEARSYSMLMLGCTLSTALWYRLVVDSRRRWLLAYVVAAFLTLHAHYLAGLIVVAHAVWYFAVWRFRTWNWRPLRPLLALLIVAVLCIPMAWRYFYYESSMFQVLTWIEPPTWRSTLEVLEQLTFGWQWIFGLSALLLLLWLASALGVSSLRPRRSGGPLIAGRMDICGLLFLCFLGGWFGLLVISWLGHPAMVARYALPAATGALLIPLVFAHRWDVRAPYVIAVAFVIGGAPTALLRPNSPGLREMAGFLKEHVDPSAEAAVLTIDNAIYPGCEDSERLGFEYYPMEGVPVEELLLDSDGVTARNKILEDPRGLYLVVLSADPFPILQAAGRQAVPIVLEGTSYSQLLFTPYRLVRVAPLHEGNDDAP